MGAGVGHLPGAGIERRAPPVLQIADGREAQNGSAARFDDLAVYLFDTRAQAEAFVERFKTGRI
ncbi:MAG: hypothetical protein FJX76_09595 [Armatimonadetes bacterium]|nr:hypothetical protein [Armatimonadota bacterium]